MIYFIYGRGHSIGLNAQLIHKLDVFGTRHTILWTACALMLCAKLVCVWRIRCIRMPGEIKCRCINAVWRRPIGINFGFVYSGLAHILDIHSLGHTILRTTGLLPLCTKLIDHGRLSIVWVPRIVKIKFGIVPTTGTGQSDYAWRFMIVGVLSIPVFGHQIHTRIFLPLTGPSVTLMALPWHRFPKKIPVTEIR